MAEAKDDELKAEMPKAARDNDGGTPSGDSGGIEGRDGGRAGGGEAG
jgi:hypothetical protein